MPLVGQIVGAELGRPVAVDVHPKHSVALGAAMIAADQAVGAAGIVTDGEDRDPEVLAPPAPVLDAPDATADPGPLPLIVAATADSIGGDDAPSTDPAPTEPMPATAAEPAPTEPIPADATPTTVLAATGAGGEPPQLDVESGGNRRGLLVGGAVAAAAVMLIGGFVLARGGGDDGVAADTTAPQVAETTATTSAPQTDTTTVTTPDTEAPSTTAAPATTTTVAATTTTTVPAPCDGITGPCVEIDSVERTPESVTIAWRAFNFSPDVNGVHPHFYWNDAEAFQAGTNAPDGQRVGWEITQDLVYTGQDVLLLANQPFGATGVCGTPGDALLDPPHSVIDPEVFHCVELP